jgi:alpha 1,2-mannosyltransferase
MTISPEDGYLSSKVLSTEQSVYKVDETPLDLASPAESKPSHSFGNVTTHDPSNPRRANATLVMLARNSDLDGVISSVEQLEAKFNHKFNYPWVFLNDEPFSFEFKRYTMSLSSAIGSSCIFRRVKVLTDADVSFGLIPRETWVQPPWIDEERARKGRDILIKEGVIYGGKFTIDQIVFSFLPLKLQAVFRAYLRAAHSGHASSLAISYRNMCRYNSGVGTAGSGGCFVRLTSV